MSTIIGMPWRIACDSSELAIESVHAAQAIGLTVEPLVNDDWFRISKEILREKSPIAIALSQPPTVEQVVELSIMARASGIEIILATPGKTESCRSILEFVGDLGITGLSEIKPMIAAIALVQGKASRPWASSVRSLPTVDRDRIRPVLSTAKGIDGQLTREDSGLIAWVPEGGGTPILLGEPRDAAMAIGSLSTTDRTTPEVISSVDGVDAQSILDIIFGPARALSDPASKAALLPYGIALPEEELCSSASRAAAEANRIGFPVRVALASPDLRIWDHPDLAVDSVDNAARVRELFRQLMSMAESRAPESRLLGVTVAATNEAVALLGVRANPLPNGRVYMEIGFADAHGKAAQDSTRAIFPAPISSIERALNRLKGNALIFSGSKAQRQQNLESISDILLRISAFVNDRRQEVERVELLPMALLIGGGAEVREACITINDTFERSLETGTD